MNEADAGCLSLSSNSSSQREDEDEDDGGLGVDYRDDADALAAMSEESGSWVDWFLGLRAHSFFCEVEDDYLGDDFNLTGLAHAVPYYDYALDLIMDVDIELETFSEEQQEIIEASAEVLYGLIHARYITSARGMQRMQDKFQRADFGRCKRVHCHGQAVLPTGMSDLPRRYFVSVFCPRCRQLFHPTSRKHMYLDGAYFGTTFPHLFILSQPDVVVRQPPAPEDGFSPRIFGFKIHPSSAYYDGVAPSTSTSRDVGAQVEGELEKSEPSDDDDDESGSGDALRPSAIGSGSNMDCAEVTPR